MSLSGSPTIDALLQLINQSAIDAVDQYLKFGGGPPELNQAHPLDTSPAGVELELRKIIRVLEGACEQLVSTLASPSVTILNVSSTAPPLLDIFLCRRN